MDLRQPPPNLPQVWGRNNSILQEAHYYEKKLGDVTGYIDFFNLEKEAFQSIFLEICQMMKKYRRSMGLTITALAVLFLLSTPDCYSAICSVGGDGGGCLRGGIPKIARRGSHPQSAGKNIVNDRNYRVSKPFVQSEETFDFTNTLEGDWPDVVGYVCVKIKDEKSNEEYYVCIIGLETVSLGNNEYKSTGWDKKVFWMEVGNGVPLFVCGIYAPNYVEDGVAYDNVYWAPNVDYYDPEDGVIYNCDMWMYLDDEDEVEECWIVMYDEDGEEIDEKQLQAGDYITTYSPAIYLDEPESFYAATIEESFQLVKEDPLFFYAHMTPNVDFSNPLTQGKIDFDDLDLYYILEGSREKEDGSAEFVYSTPKKVGIKWGNKPANTENWMMHEVSSALKFFLPGK